jgi:hypothetical protein
MFEVHSLWVMKFLCTHHAPPVSASGLCTLSLHPVSDPVSACTMEPGLVADVYGANLSRHTPPQQKLL